MPERCLLLQRCTRWQAEGHTALVGGHIALVPVGGHTALVPVGGHTAQAGSSTRRGGERNNLNINSARERTCWLGRRVFSTWCDVIVGSSYVIIPFPTLCPPS